MMYRQMTTSFSPSQQRVISLVPVPGAVVSMASAVAAAIFVLLSRNRRSDSYHRKIFIIGVNIVIYSSSICFGSVPPVYGARGSIQTCEAQGFIQYISRFISMLYYASIPLVISSKFYSDSVKRWINISIHLVCNSIPWILALIALSLKYINPLIGCAFCGITFMDGRSKCILGKICSTTLLVCITDSTIGLLCIVSLSSIISLFVRIKGSGDTIMYIALHQSSVHFLALVVCAALDILAHCSMSSTSHSEFSVGYYISMIAIYPSVGVIQLLAYFIVERTWPYSIQISATVNTGSSTDIDSEIQQENHGEKRGNISYRMTYKIIEYFIPRCTDRRRDSFTNVSTQERAECVHNADNTVIFDGRNPSKRWSTFLSPNDIDLGELDDDDESKYYSDIIEK